MSSEQVAAFPWMNNDYFKSILIKYEGHDNLQFSDFNISTGANKGENFASAIYRIKLSYLLNGELKDTNFIVKTGSESSAISEMLNDMGTFDMETSIYENILTECEKLFTNFKVSPRLVHVDKNALVLEDLNCLNFKLANRQLRFDLPRAKIVLKKLAKFHAASALMHEKNPELMKMHLSSAINSDEMTPIAYFFIISMQETLETVRNTPELLKFLPLLEGFDIIERGQNVFTRNAEEKFHVLNHGDLWINNIFFSYNEQGEPVDAILVDYQECFWGSPGVDLNHFLYTSCDFDVHENHIDELIKYYHDHLSDALKEIGFSKIPSLEVIQEEFLRKADQGLTVLCSIVPVMMIEDAKNANPENFIADGEGAAAIRREVYGNPKFVDALKYFLPKFVDKKDF